MLLCPGFQDAAQRAVLQREPHQREAHNCGDEYVAECDARTHTHAHRLTHTHAHTSTPNEK